MDKSQIINGYNKYKSDLLFIKNEIICKQPDGNYCKYSLPLRAVSVYNLSKDTYINYWVKQYKNTKYLNNIISACNNKLDNNLTSVDKMIQLVQISKEKTEEIDKIIKVLKGA